MVTHTGNSRAQEVEADGLSVSESLDQGKLKKQS